MLIPMPAALTVAHFARLVRVLPSGCWEWLGPRLPRGYGSFKRRTYAHRFAYRTRFGAIPDGLEIDHLCRNCWCVNPDHLEAVLHLVNVQRGAAVKRACPQGHEYTAENTFRQHGHKACRICRRRYQAIVRARKREAARV